MRRFLRAEADSLIFLVGMALVVAGVAIKSTWIALIVAGLALAATGIGVARARR